MAAALDRLDQYASRMRGATLPLQRLAYVVGHSRRLRELLAAEFPLLDNPASEQDPEIRMLRETAADIVWEYCSRGGDDRKPDSARPLIHYYLATLVERYSMRPDVLLQKAFVSDVELGYSAGIPNLLELIDPYLTTRRRTSFEALALSVGFELRERPVTLSLAAAIVHLEALKGQLEQGLADRQLIEESLKACREFDEVLLKLVEFYVFSLPADHFPKGRTMLPTSDMTLGAKVQHWLRRENDVRNHCGHAYLELFVAPECGLDFQTHEPVLQFLVFFRNVCSHYLSSTITGKGVRLPPGDGLGILREALSESWSLFEGLTPNSKNQVELDDVQVRQIAITGCDRLLDFYVDVMRERCPVVQIHKHWNGDVGVLEYLDWQGEPRQVKVAGPSPFINQEVFARELPGGRLLWMPVKYTADAPYVADLILPSLDFGPIRTGNVFAPRVMSDSD